MSRRSSLACHRASRKQTVRLPQAGGPSWQRRVLLVMLLASFSGGCNRGPTTPVDVPSGEWEGILHGWRDSAEQHTFGLLLNEHRGTISGNWRLTKTGVPLFESIRGEVTGRHNGRVNLTLHAGSGASSGFGSFQGSLAGSTVLRGTLSHEGRAYEVSLLKVHRTGRWCFVDCL